VENFSPVAVLFGAAPVALVDDDEVEKFRRKLAVNVLFFIHPIINIMGFGKVCHEPLYDSQRQPMFPVNNIL
jgi:hypothetical protein